MENLTYRYVPNSNKLDHVIEDFSISDAAYTIDIDGQDTMNYRYDSIGNLSKDIAEGKCVNRYW